MMLVDELLASLFDGQPHLLAELMGTWLASSRRFTAFVTAHQTKIRKKLRTVQEPESLRDLRLELETAYLLLREKSLSVTYEPGHPELGRSPDFAVSFTTSLTFMVEVTRLRAAQKRTSAQAGATHSSNNAFTSPQVAESLAETICGKLGQLLIQRSNVLIVGVDVLLPMQTDIHAAMLRVQQRAERNDPTFWQRYRFRDRADFFHHYQRLSEVLARGSQLQADEPVVDWVNPQAKYPLPARVHTALLRSHTL